jgi:hypothetical protein
MVRLAPTRSPVTRDLTDLAFECPPGDASARTQRTWLVAAEAAALGGGVRTSRRRGADPQRARARSSVTASIAGGNRRLNRALHTIVLARRRTNTETMAYIARRVSEGKSEREAVRCLKRYFARSLFRLLEAMPADLTLIEASPTPGPSRRRGSMSHRRPAKKPSGETAAWSIG